jgi:hypothetical protein
MTANEYQLWPLDIKNGKQSVHTLVQNLTEIDLKSLLFACGLLCLKGGLIVVANKMEALMALPGTEACMIIKINTVRRIVNGIHLGYYTNITIKDVTASCVGKERATTRSSARMYGRNIDSISPHPHPAGLMGFQEKINHVS